MDINSRDLAYFLEVARSRSLTQSALRLSVTQPALSYSLKRFEESLGVQLFLRSKSGIKLTRAGEKAYKQALEILEKVQSFKKDLSDEVNEAQGILRIAIHPSVAHYFLAPVLSSFIREQPKIEFQFKHGLSRLMLEEVVEYRADFGVIVNPLAHPDLVLKKLFEDEVSFWYEKGAPQDTLIYDPEMIQSQSLLKKWPKRVLRSITTSDLEYAAQLCAGGAGIAVLPGRVARMCKLKPYLQEASSYKDQIFLAYRKDLQIGRASQLFKDFLLSSKT